MGTLTDQRSYNYRTPGHVAVSRWLDKRYVTIGETETTQKEIELSQYRFAPVSMDDIWVEDARPTTDNAGKCLVTFSIRKRGYAILDAVIDLITVEDMIAFYKIPVRRFATYQELITYIKTNKEFALYKVATSPDGKYGLLDDTSMVKSARYNSFIDAFAEIGMDVNVSYSDATPTLTAPVVGSIAFSHGSLKTFTVEAYHYQDLIKL